MSGCKWCDQGIMTLEPLGISAPCVACSPTRKLSDLERERDARYRAEELEVERAMIREHNARIGAKEETPCSTA
jgi:hypothetical protein